MKRLLGDVSRGWGRGKGSADVTPGATANQLVDAVGLGEAVVAEREHTPEIFNGDINRTLRTLHLVVGWLVILGFAIFRFLFRLVLSLLRKFPGHDFVNLSNNQVPAVAREIITVILHH